MREQIRRTKQKENSLQKQQPAAKTAGIPNSTLEAVFEGKARASSEMMGHRQDLAPSLASKMSRAFGMDLSGMQVYRSDAMKGTEAEGMASGNKVVLSRDINLNTVAGQAVLGHEISHIRAQSQGIGMGHTGLYSNADLEQQADVEGMRAARGQNIAGESTGMETGPGMGGLIPMGPGVPASAGAPLQAKGKGKKKKNGKDRLRNTPENQIPSEASPIESTPATAEDVINKVQWKNGENDKTFNQIKGNQKMGDWVQFCLGSMKSDKTRANRLTQAYLDAGGKASGRFGGAEVDRLVSELSSQVGAGTSDEDMIGLMQNMASKDKEKQLKAKLAIKEMHYQELLRREKKYGKLLEQMNPEDIADKGGTEGFGADITYGTQMSDVNTATESYEDVATFKDKKKEKHYKELNDYFMKFNSYMQLRGFFGDENSNTQDFLQQFRAAQKDAKGNSVIQNGPALNEKQLAAYKKKWNKK